MLKVSELFEELISAILLVFAMLIISYQVIQLVWNTVESFSARFREAMQD